jgi:cell division protein FtsB
MTATNSGERGSARPTSRGRRPVETGFRRKALGLAAFLILAATALNAFFGESGILGLRKAQKEYEALLHEVEALRADNDSLAQQIRAFRTDPLVIERMAREMLGMAKPDEIVVTIRHSDR